MLTLLQNRTVLEMHFVSQDGDWTSRLRLAIAERLKTDSNIAVVMSLAALQLAMPQPSFQDWFKVQESEELGYIGSFGPIWVLSDSYSRQKVLNESQVEIVRMEQSWSPPMLN